jgi:thiaminase/transcriptional activator TenA
MLSGTLPLPTFKHYVVQDAMYLTEFAACLRRLSKAAPTVDLAGRFEDFAKGAEEAEMGLHRGYFDSWGIKPVVGGGAGGGEGKGEKVDFTPTTMMYTSYMTAVVATRPWHEGVAALLPCFWVYQWVGDIMLQKREEMKSRGEYGSEKNEVYDKWIDMYGGEDFEKEVKEYKQILEDACEGVDGEGPRKGHHHHEAPCPINCPIFVWVPPPRLLVTVKFFTLLNCRHSRT